MRRRAFLALTLTGILSRAEAQHSRRVYRIALVSPANPVSTLTATGEPNYRALFDELRQLGFVEGENLKVERYSGEGRTERYPDLVAEVVRSKPDLIFTLTNRLVRVFSNATTTIPIVSYVGDPVGEKLVASLARPGGNVTGIVSDVGIEFHGKKIELLGEVLGGTLSRVGLLNLRIGWNPPDRAAPSIYTLISGYYRSLGERFGIAVIGGVLDDYQEHDYHRAFARLKEARVDGVIVGGDAEQYTRRELIVRLAAEHALPAVYPNRVFVQSGGLVSYGIDLPMHYRRAAGLIARILNGASPAETPMEQADKFELVDQP